MFKIKIDIFDPNKLLFFLHKIFSVFEYGSSDCITIVCYLFKIFSNFLQNFPGIFLKFSLTSTKSRGIHKNLLEMSEVGSGNKFFFIKMFKR